MARERRLKVQAIMMGNISEAIVQNVVSALPYAEEVILRACVEEVLPKRGIIIEATKEELEDNKDLGGILYHDVEIKPKESK